MARKDVEQFNLRLNLNNPNHLKIYRTFQDLNTDIHKSRNKKSPILTQKENHILLEKKLAGDS